MAVEFTVYNPLNQSLVADLSSDVVHHSFTVGLNGDLNGSTQIEIKPENKALLLGMNENSYFIVVSVGKQRHGGVVESSRFKDGIATVNYTGLMGYLDKIHALPSHKSNLGRAARTVGDNDKSWVKTFYSDTPVGLLYGLFYNLERTMVSEGYNSPFDFSGMADEASTSGSIGRVWNRTFRINGLDLSSMRDAVEGVLDDGQQVLAVEIDTTSRFKWSIKSMPTHERSTPLSKIDFFNGQLDEGESIQRSASWAVGTDAVGRETVARLPVNSTVAYSSYFAEGKPEGHKNIARYNESAAANLKNGNKQVRFSMYSDDIRVTNKVSIDLGHDGRYEIVINEIAVEGNIFSYTGQVVETQSGPRVEGIRKAMNSMRNVVYKPLSRANRAGTTALRRVKRSTGFRS